MINNLRFVIYTHEKNQHLVELNLKYFFKHNKRQDLKITVVSNKFQNCDFKYGSIVNYHSSNVELNSQGYHFRETMLNALNEIKEEYVLFLLDDYFFIDEIKYHDLEDALNLMKCENIEYFGFDDIGGALTLNDFEKFNTECESNIKDNLYIRHTEYQYLFSVQPCIWNRVSLIKLLGAVENMSIHDLDETTPNIRDFGGGIKSTISGLKSCFDHSIDFLKQEKPDEYYIIAYIELVRHGCFNMPENGKPVNPNDYNVMFTYKLIGDEDLGSNIGFKHLLPPSFYKLNN